MHQTNDRLWRAAHPHDDLANPALTHQARNRAVTLTPRTGGRRFFQIQPGAKGTPRTPDHHDTNGVVHIKALKIIQEIVDQLGVQGVQPLRTVQRHPIHFALFFNRQRFIMTWHCPLR